MINKAIEFATKAHANQTRKMTNIPYILHCLEAGTIALSLSTKNDKVNSDVVSAAILHDTIEDAGITYEELKREFNERIADLVMFQSEDKSKTWIERKQQTIDFLYGNQDRDVEVVFLADKLSNVRSLYKEHLEKGDQLWEKFNAPKDMQAWYYVSIGLAMKQLEGTTEYNEYKALLEQLFTTSEIEVN